VVGDPLAHRRRNLQIETGFIRRQSLRIPLARIQAVDVISPLLGRFLGLAEVRVVSAGRGAAHGRLAYLNRRSGARGSSAAARARPTVSRSEPPNRRTAAAHVQNGLLLPALLMRSQVLGPIVIAVAAARRSRLRRWSGRAPLAVP